MKNTNGLNRRRFNQLAASAFGGMMAGSVIGCGSSDDGGNAAADANTPASDDTASDSNADMPTGSGGGGDAVAKADVHICRGLNACKNKGAGGENACAGQGTCATAEAHSCAGQNTCHGQGGCGEHPGENECKGKGKCGVPLSEDAWAAARTHFEEHMKEDGKEVGAAPAKG